MFKKKVYKLFNRFMLILHKLYLKIHNNKFIEEKSNFIISKDITTGSYLIWFMSGFNLVLFDICEDKESAKFKFDILMK